VNRELYGSDWWLLPHTLDHYRPSHIPDAGAPSGALVLYTVHQMEKKRNHGDTRISLHPLTFDEAMAKLAQAKREDSPAAESGNTKEDGRESAPSRKRTARRRKPSAD